MLLIKVMVFNPDNSLFRRFIMDHDEVAQRRVLGEQCRNAFEAGQTIKTQPIRAKES